MKRTTELKIWIDFSVQNIFSAIFLERSQCWSMGRRSKWIKFSDCSLSEAICRARRKMNASRNRSPVFNGITSDQERLLDCPHGSSRLLSVLIGGGCATPNDTSHRWRQEQVGSVSEIDSLSKALNQTKEKIIDSALANIVSIIFNKMHHFIIPRFISWTCK